MTTMNTGAASLRDEQRTTIQHAADKLRTVWANHTGDKESRELCHKLEALLAAATPQADADFKNFHRLLCERFGYVHDEKDWKRDQLSLIEHIASRAAIAAGGAQEPIYQEWIGSAWVDVDDVQYAGAQIDKRRIVYAAPLPRVAATVTLTEERAVEIAAQCWCQLEASGIAMDPRLGEAFARALLATASNGEQS